MYKCSYIYITQVREDFIRSTRSQKLLPLYPLLRKRLHLPKWESKLRKKKTKDPENRLMQERNEGNSQDHDKSKFKHDCYLVDLKCNQFSLEEDRKLLRGTGWGGDREKSIDHVVCMTILQYRDFTVLSISLSWTSKK